MIDYQVLKMSASSTPTLISKSTEKMKLVLSKDNRVLPILSKPSPGNFVTKATTTPSVPKSVTSREAPPKLESNATCAKPIVVPSVPNLLSILNGQSTLSQFFSATVPPTSSAVPPYISTAPPNTHSTVPPHTHSTAASQHIKPIASFYDKLVQQHTQATLTTHPKQPTLKPKKDSVSAAKLPAKLPKIPPKVTNSIAGTTKIPQVRQPENGVNDRDIQPPKPKKAKVTGNSSLPLSRVRTIMKTHVQSSQNIVNTGQESVAIITRATELFIADLAKRSGEKAKGKGLVTYNHLADAVQQSKDLHFVHAVVPKKVLAKDYIPSPSLNGSTSDN